MKAAALLLALGLAACGGGGGGTPRPDAHRAGADVFGCGNMGNPGNSLGVGKYCTKGGGQCASNGCAIFCTADVDPTAPPFCTFPCTSDSQCGAGAICTGTGSNKGCVPAACGMPPDAGSGKG